MEWLMNDNGWGARMLRTVIEAALAFVIANLAVMLSGSGMDATVVSAITAAATAILSPVLAAFKKADKTDDAEKEA